MKEYRPEIDGLRTIAVFSVILYHAQINILGHDFFKGGFIGVDIFFVISGYLITSLILKEFINTGNFSFIGFYQRRVRRILPALFFVILLSLPLAWFILLPTSFISFAKSILYSLGFSSNFYFLYSGLEYSSQASLLKPFLHTWSLSVEEQFYIFFPIILIISIKLFKKYTFYLLVLIIFLSLFYADYSSQQNPIFSFYFTLTRVWELLIGSILAYVEVHHSRKSSNTLINQTVTALGLFLILHSIIFYNDQANNPSFYTLIPIMGTCFIIWFSHKKEIVTLILSSKIFVGFGLISYSLYLWHFPIFAFARSTEFIQGDIIKKLFVGILVIILSIITYFFIEKPFRNKKITSIKFLLNSIIISLVFIVAFNSIIILNNGFENRHPRMITEINISPWNLLRDSNKNLCHDNLDFCTFNDVKKNKIFLIGDSHMSSIMNDLKDKTQKENFSFTTMTQKCLGIPEFNFVNDSDKILKFCQSNYYEKALKKISINSNNIIIFGGRFPLYLSGNEFLKKKLGPGIKLKEWHKLKHELGVLTPEQGYRKFIKDLLQKDNFVILIYPIPEIGFDPLEKLKNLDKKIFQEIINNNTGEFLTTNYEFYKERAKKSFDLLDSIKHKNILRVYPHKLFCNTIIVNKCLIHDSKNLFYADSHHPSIKSSELINDLIMKKIRLIKNIY